MGELEQASQATPFLDLWILVTTKQIDPLSRDQLLTKGSKENIEILFIDTKNFHPYSLDLLFATGRDIVLKFIKEKSTDKGINIQKIKEYLDGLTDKKEYNLHKQHLLDDLIRFEISCRNWRVNQNKWLLAQFSSKERSKASFHQCINVNDKNIKLIERQEVNQNLNNWLESWKNEKCIFALLGEEGDGKTWSVAAWITELIKKENNPPVVFSDSNSLNSEEIDDILYQAVCKNRHSSYKLYRDKWIKRFNKWLDRPGTEEPLIILVIDGVNENFSYKWRLLFEKLNDEDWNGKVGVTLTCRKVFREEKFSKLKDFRVKTWTLKSFDDAELNDALEKNGLKYSDFPQNIFKLLRKPRYFDLAARNRDVMSESGDITIERLIYEDSKNRINRYFRSNLSDRDYNTFIIKRAEKYREGAERFSYSELKSDIYENLEELVNELRTSGVIITNSIRDDIFTVEKRRLEYGLGILLVDQLSQNPELSSIDALEESFAGFMEPYQDMDIMVRIMSYALICAIEKRREVPKDIIFLLLYKLLDSRNLNDLVWDSFPAYFPCCPDIYFEVAERIYKKDNYNPMGRKIVLHTFAKWIEKGDSKINELFRIKFEDWLGYVYINDTIYTRISDKEKVEKNKKRIIRIVDNHMVKQALSSLNYEIKIIENSDISWVSDLALAVISFTDCNYFLRAVIAGVISDAVMGYPERSEEFAWIIRANKKKVWNNLKKEVEKLIDTGVLVAKQAAYRLLSYEGRPEAISLKAELSKNISMKDKMREDHEKDPCKTIFALDKSNYYKCLSREDINFNGLIK